MSVQDDIFDLEEYLKLIPNRAKRADARRCFRSMMHRLNAAEVAETDYANVVTTVRNLKRLLETL